MEHTLLRINPVEKEFNVADKPALEAPGPRRRGERKRSQDGSLHHGLCTMTAAEPGGLQ